MELRKIAESEIAEYRKNDGMGYYMHPDIDKFTSIDDECTRLSNEFLTEFDVKYVNMEFDDPDLFNQIVNNTSWEAGEYPVVFWNPTPPDDTGDWILLSIFCNEDGDELACFAKKKAVS